jgi:hypothetical protein
MYTFNYQLYIVLILITHILISFTRFCDNLHQVRLKSKDWKAKYLKVLGAIKPKGLSRITKIGYGHMSTPDGGQP